MRILKCDKCGSSNITLKHTQEEEQNKTFEKVLRVFLTIFTLGLYLVFYLHDEKKQTTLGTSYYECENCHYKMNANDVQYHIEETPKQEIDEEEIKAIKKVGENPIEDINKWKKEREAVVRKRRKLEEKKRKKQKKC